MAKKLRKGELPSVESMNQMGFTDGYTGSKSRSNALIEMYSKKRINSNEIKNKIMAYSLGYEKGRLISKNGLDNTKAIGRNNISVNNEIVELNDYTIEKINNKIEEYKKPKARRR